MGLANVKPSASLSDSLSVMALNRIESFFAPASRRIVQGKSQRWRISACRLGSIYRGYPTSSPARIASSIRTGCDPCWANLRASPLHATWIRRRVADKLVDIVYPLTPDMQKLTRTRWLRVGSECIRTNLRKSEFQKFPVGGMPPDPPSQFGLCPLTSDTRPAPLPKNIFLRCCYCYIGALVRKLPS